MVFISILVQNSILFCLQCCCNRFDIILCFYSYLPICNDCMFRYNNELIIILIYQLLFDDFSMFLIITNLNPSWMSHNLSHHFLWVKKIFEFSFHKSESNFFFGKQSGCLKINIFAYKFITKDFIFRYIKKS